MTYNTGNSTVGSFTKVAYIRDWIQLDIYINPTFPIS